MESSWFIEQRLRGLFEEADQSIFIGISGDTRSQTAVGRPSDLDAWLRRVVASVIDVSGVPGAAVNLNVDGRTYSAAVGVADRSNSAPITNRSRFELSCLMKTLTASTVLALDNQGVLKIDDCIAKFMPELRDCEDITFRHLLTHSSGYRGLNILDPKIKWSMNWARFVTHLASSPRQFPAGTVFNYEHSEHVILAQLVKRVTGQDVMALCRSMFLSPLDISPVRRAASCDLVDVVAHHNYSTENGDYEVVSPGRPGRFLGRFVARRYYVVARHLDPRERNSSAGKR